STSGCFMKILRFPRPILPTPMKPKTILSFGPCWGIDLEFCPNVETQSMPRVAPAALATPRFRNSLRCNLPIAQAPRVTRQGSFVARFLVFLGRSVILGLPKKSRCPLAEADWFAVHGLLFWA